MPFFFPSRPKSADTPVKAGVGDRKVFPAFTGVSLLEEIGILLSFQVHYRSTSQYISRNRTVNSFVRLSYTQRQHEQWVCFVSVAVLHRHIPRRLIYNRGTGLLDFREVRASSTRFGLHAGSVKLKTHNE